MSDKAPMNLRKPEDVLVELDIGPRLRSDVIRADRLDVAAWMARPVTGAECFRRRHETVADVVNKILTARLAKLKESING